jgi:hypothetical protein
MVFSSHVLATEDKIQITFKKRRKRCSSEDDDPPLTQLKDFLPIILV